jgi:hypothetical protein
LLISAAAALQSGRTSRAAVEMCASCSLTAFTVIVKGRGARFPIWRPRSG